jgi:hypothetical protein
MLTTGTGNRGPSGQHFRIGEVGEVEIDGDESVDMGVFVFPVSWEMKNIVSTCIKLGQKWLG